jgi:hypothetical protein
MFSKREAEGYLLVDHRQSHGVTPEEVPTAKRLLFSIRCARGSATGAQSVMDITVRDVRWRQK